VLPFKPAVQSASGLVEGWRVLGVAMTNASGNEPVVVMSRGILRGLGINHITGWEPAVGASLWCGTNGKMTTTRPTTGVQVFVGTYLGGGNLEVYIQVLPSLSELSFVTRATPVSDDVLIWSGTQWVHVQHNPRRWAWMSGGI